MSKVPKGFTVVRAFRSENSRIWREYGVKRARLLTDFEAHGAGMMDQYKDVLSTVAWSTHGGLLADRLKPEINEWYLFHGSSDTSAKSICKTDFKLGLAGVNTGTLYGHRSNNAHILFLAEVKRGGTRIFPHFLSVYIPVHLFVLCCCDLSFV